MLDNTKKISKYIAGILIAGFFLYFTLKGKDIEEIKKQLQSAKPLYWLSASFLYLMSFWARSEKWRIQIENIKYKIRSEKVFKAVIFQYFFNTFTPKLGIFARCSEMKKNSKLPISVCLGTILSEAIFDNLFLFIAILIVLFFHFKNIFTLISNFIIDINSKIHINITYLILIAGILILIFEISRHKKIYKKNRRIDIFITTLSKTFKLKKFKTFLLWNLILWIFLLSFNYFLLKSVYFGTINFSLVITITVFTYFAWLMPTPGGIGSVEYFTLQAFALYGIDEHLAISFGILSNAITFFSILLFTPIAVIFINKKTSSNN